MIIYPEQTRTFHDCKDRTFVISIFCSGAFAFEAKDSTTNEPVTFIRSFDIVFVNEMVRQMKGRPKHESDPIIPFVEIFEQESEETA